MAFKVHEKYEIEFEKGWEYDEDEYDYIFFIQVFLHEIPRTDFSISMKYSYESETNRDINYDNSQENADKAFKTVFAKTLKWLDMTN